MNRTFEYRLYPSRRQRSLLMKCLIESRRLYNEMLALTRDHHALTGEFLFKYSLTARFKGRGGEHVPASDSTVCREWGGWRAPKNATVLNAKC
ncbi:MAG: helix-turn-helix domain-containing protein [Rubrobacteraceae bacterium]